MPHTSSVSTELHEKQDGDETSCCHYIDAYSNKLVETILGADDDFSKWCSLLALGYSCWCVICALWAFAKGRTWSRYGMADMLNGHIWGYTVSWLALKKSGARKFGVVLSSVCGIPISDTNVLIPRCSRRGEFRLSAAASEPCHQYQSTLNSASMDACMDLTSIQVNNRAQQTVIAVVMNLLQFCCNLGIEFGKQKSKQHMCVRVRSKNKK